MNIQRYIFAENIQCYNATKQNGENNFLQTHIIYNFLQMRKIAHSFAGIEPGKMFLCEKFNIW